MRRALPALALSAAALGALASEAATRELPPPCPEPDTRPGDADAAPSGPAPPGRCRCPDGVVIDPTVYGDPMFYEECNSADGGGSPSGHRQRQHRATRRRPAPRAANPRSASQPSPRPAEPTAASPDVFPGFEIPLFLLPIYRAAEAEYGVPWQVLAAINSIESDFGRNTSTSSAGARGWMQFMPQTWSAYGTDANRDGLSDPYNPIDAVFGAARYLRAAGAEYDLRAALYAYNHAGWYVDAVLARSESIGRSDAVADALTGLATGRVPVAAPARWRAAGSEWGPAAVVYARRGSPVVAVADGVIADIGESKRSGGYVVIEDASGDRYVYTELGWVARERTSPARSRPAAPASQAPRRRLFAHPLRPRTRAGGGFDQLVESGVPVPHGVGYRDYFTGASTTAGARARLGPLRRGSPVVRGAIVGRVGGGRRGATGQFRFAIRPPGSGAPRIDPQPILDSWRRLEVAGAFRPSGRSVLAGAADPASIARMLTLPQRVLERRVLADPRVAIYPCGRADIAAGYIDRRVIVTLELLADSGLYPTVSSLECGHDYLTASGNVSEHSSGDAVDIAAINGEPILGHQDSDSATATVVRYLASLRGEMRPHQIISLMTLPGSDNTLALPDHDDHIHVGFRPHRDPGGPLGGRLPVGLEAQQWRLLSAQLAAVRNPAVRGPASVRQAWLRAHAQARRGGGGR